MAQNKSQTQSQTPSLSSPLPSTGRQAAGSSVACACEKCTCMVNTETGISRNGQYYCSDACANGHTNGNGCGGSSGCGCGS